MSEKYNMTTPICDFVRDYSNSEYSRFHMPGHKGHSPFADSENYPDIPYGADITEICGADSLYEASGIIAQSEANASELFGTAATFYSTEGSSQCIRAMLALVTNWNKKSGRPLILAARNVHRSFITAAAMLDFDIKWLCSYDSAYSLCSCPVTADMVKEAIKSCSSLPAAIYLTSPDYLGNLQNIKEIAQAAHSYDVPLIVDNAHGAYLHFLECSLHPIDLGADLCCDSAHKTLPALTGCAYLHISRTASPEYIKNAKKALSLFASTSPSYLLLESLDLTNKVLHEEFRDKLSSIVKKISRIRDILRDNGWNILGNTYTDHPAYEPMKITVDARSYDLTGSELAGLLRNENIECEYADPDYVVLMPSPYSHDEDFEKLIKAMKAIAEKAHSKKAADSSAERLSFTLPKAKLSVREAMFSASETIPADLSAGRICADTAVFCPPAVPIVICGEVISEEHIPLLKYYGFNEISVIK